MLLEFVELELDDPQGFQAAIRPGGCRVNVGGDFGLGFGDGLD